MNNDEVLQKLSEEFKKEKAPESLSGENMLKKLNTAKQQKAKVISLRKITTAIAAVLVAVIVGGFGLSIGYRQFVVSPDEALDAADTTTTKQASVAQNSDSESLVFKKVKTDKELQNIFLELYNNSVKAQDIYNYYVDSALLDSNVTVAAPSANSASGSDLKGEVYYSNNITEEVLTSYGETNVQVLGVDEGDVLKNDGRYLYIVGSDINGNTKLRIADTTTMSYVYNDYIYSENGDIVNIEQLYLYENKLVILTRKLSTPNIKTGGYNYYSYSYYYESGSEVVVYVYDIEDKSDIKLEKTTTQSGAYVSSRLIDGVLYTVSRHSVPLTSEEEIKERFMPKINGEYIGCDCIYIQDENSQRYVHITANDITNKDSEIGKIAILGGGNIVYCSTENLYIASNQYFNSSEYKDKELNPYGFNSKTVINAFKLEGTTIIHTATGEVPGEIEDQYWMDEKDGYLRVGVNYYSYDSGKESNALFVLSSELSVVGEIMNIAKDENIESIRFMGDKGYVVTFEQVDPLFTFDLSDPKNPKITGELKLPGYSTYLHPISDTLLLGVGYDGTESNAIFNNVKVSLFDVSDMANPIELDNIVLKNQYSEINDGNAKAFMYIADKNFAVISTSEDDYNKANAEDSCNLIKIDGNKLELYADYEHGTGSSEYMRTGKTMRGTYIGNDFYCVSSNIITRFDLSTNEKTGQCKLD